MHDTVIANKIKEDAESKAEGKIKGIVLELGELASLDKHMLEHSMEHVCGWDVKVEEKEAKVKCKCGFEGKPKIIERMHDFVLFECPECGDTPEVVSGGDIVIKEVEVE